MPINRHISLLENRVGLLQNLLRQKSSQNLGNQKDKDISYACLQNVVAEGDGWSDWEDFIDHGRYAAIERNWHERTLKALERLGIESVKLDDLKRLESSPSRDCERTGTREASM